MSDNEGSLAAATLEALARFEVLQYNGMIGWFCRPCRHLSFVARDFEGDQSDLTLGEMAESALEHECRVNYDMLRMDVNVPNRGDGEIEVPS